VESSGTRQQIGGVLLSIGGGVLALVLPPGVGIALGVALVLIGLWLVIEPAAPWALPIVRERDALGRLVFRPQVPRLHQQRRVKRAELRQKGAALSTRIFEMAGEARRTDLSRRAHWASPSWEGMSKEERDRLFWEQSERSIQHATDLMVRYNVECAAEALALHDEFHRLGVTDGKKRDWFERPTNPLGLEEVARLLGVWAKKV
jgi:hypothetical protein